MSDLLAEYERISGRLPCPVCGNSKSWCLVARDRTTAICPRVCEGSERQVGDAGYLHRLVATTEKVKHYAPFHPRQDKRRDFGDVWGLLQQAATASIVKDSADRLGVSVESLRMLGVGYHTLAAALTFPMYDDQGVCGIRLRRVEDGFKYAMLGSKNGVFMRGLPVKGEVCVIVEGPTDAAAALTMGFKSVVGRPFCKGGNQIIAGFLAQWEPSCVVIVADSDPVGVEGGEKLANELCASHDVRLIEPLDGAKDMRAWLRLGATRRSVETAAETAPSWREQ